MNSMLKLGDVATLVLDKYSPSSGAVDKKCSNLENFVEGTGRISGYSNATENLSIKTAFKSGDILFGKLRPYLKKFAKPDFDGVCTTEVLAFRASEKINNDYLFQIISSDSFIQHNVSAVFGTKMPRTDWNIAKEYKFFVPSFDTQKKIADILTSIDRKIEATINLIEKNKVIKTGLISELIQAKSSKIGDFIFLSELAYGVRGVSYSPNQLLNEHSKNAFTLLRSNNIKDNRINFDEIQLVPAKLVSEAQRMKRGDVAVCMSNGSKSLVGKSAPFSEEVECENLTVGAFCSIFRPRNEIDASFVKHLFQSTFYQKHIDIILAGSAINNLQNKVIEELKIPMIKNESRIEIGDILDSFDFETNSLIHMHEKLKLQKQGLMQDLLTGRVRVGF